MNGNIENITDPDVFEFGTEVLNLYKLSSNNLDIEKTFVVSNKIFYEYKKFNLKNFNGIESISESICNHFTGYNFIDISISFYCKNTGIPNLNKIPLDLNSIKKTIIKIYNLWFEDKAKAYRITYSIPDQNTYPALFIQPHRSEINSFVTRCPKTGQLTNQKNVENLGNTIKIIKEEYEELFNNIEKILQSPIQFEYFMDNNHIKIRNTEIEMMTPKANWYAINELLFKSVISKENYIKLLEPKMIFEKSKACPDINNENSPVSKITGLPASAGIASGKLVFSNNPIDNFNEDSIFCCKDMSPDDLDKFIISIGGLSCRGGLTSHLAVAARGLGKPAITGAQFDIDFEAKELIIGSKKYPEYCYTLINGNKGEAYISNNPIKMETSYNSNASDEALKTSFEVVKSLSSSDSFKNYSIEFQKKISIILSAFNKIGFNI